MNQLVELLLEIGDLLAHAAGHVERDDEIEVGKLGRPPYFRCRQPATNLLHASGFRLRVGQSLLRLGEPAADRRLLGGGIRLHFRQSLFRPDQSCLDVRESAPQLLGSDGAVAGRRQLAPRVGELGQHLFQALAETRVGWIWRRRQRHRRRGFDPADIRKIRKDHDREQNERPERRSEEIQSGHAEDADLAVTASHGRSLARLRVLRSLPMASGRPGEAVETGRTGRPGSQPRRGSSSHENPAPQSGTNRRTVSPMRTCDSGASSRGASTGSSPTYVRDFPPPPWI